MSSSHTGEAAIEVRGLTKRYRIGGALDHHRTLRKAVTDGFVKAAGRAGVGRSAEPEQATREISAVDDVSFSIAPGEVVGLIGDNGAGKSTLMKILANVTTPSSGEAIVRGRVGSLLEVGTGFHPELTGRENVYLNGAILGLRHAEIEERFDAIVAFSEIEEFLDTPVKHYSSGMALRLAFSVAAHVDTEILLIDEVLAVGDVAFQRKCLARIESSIKDDRTVLFTSHDLGAIGRLCPRVLWMRKGRIEKDGPAEEVLDAYLSAETVSVVGQASASVADAFDLPSGGDPRGSAVSVQPRTVAGVPSTQFRLGQAWRIVVTFRIDQPSPQVVVKLAFISLPEVRVTTIMTHPSDLAPGWYDVEFEMSLWLRPGGVRMSVMLESDGVEFYRAREIGPVTIERTPIHERPVVIATGDLLGTEPFFDIRPAEEP